MARKTALEGVLKKRGALSRVTWWRGLESPKKDVGRKRAGGHKSFQGQANRLPNKKTP
jgi:hypothetical protein